MFGFHLFKIGVHLLLLLLLLFYSEDTSILIIEKNKTKQGIKQADKKIKMCLDFIFLKQGFIFFFYSEDTSILIIKKNKKKKQKNKTRNKIGQIQITLRVRAH